MASYYKRIQTVISYGEEDLFHFVDSQNMKNSLYIKKLIREEMLRQAGKGAVLPQAPSTPAAKEETNTTPQQEVKQIQQPEPVVQTPVQEEENTPPRKPVKVGGGMVF